MIEVFSSIESVQNADKKIDKQDKVDEKIIIGEMLKAEQQITECKKNYLAMLGKNVSLKIQEQFDELEVQFQTELHNLNDRLERSNDILIDDYDKILRV